jgi:hypothetical protein
MRVAILLCVTATVWFIAGLAFGMKFEDLKVALGILISGLAGAGVRALMGKG